MRGIDSVDSDRCLHCLSGNSTLKFEAISFSSSSSSQIIGGINWPTPISGSLLKDKKCEKEEEDEADDEDGEVGSRVLAF